MSSSFLVFAIGSIVLQLSSAELQIVKRAEWGAQPAKIDQLTTNELPLTRVVIAHTAGANCSEQEKCVQQVRSLQNFQMNVAHFADIGYHFLVGNDGRIYEGRSLNQQGAFARGANEGSLGIAFMGTYLVDVPTDAALAAAQALIEQSVRQGQLSENYQLFGHLQLSPTSSPGQALYAIIQKWPHWSSTQ